MTSISTVSVREADAVDYPCVMDQTALSSFNADHPAKELNIFLIMRFERHPHRDRIHRLIREAAADLGFDVFRADDRDYSGELWTNVKLCMESSSLAIAVFDGLDAATENLGVELGYVFAKGIPCLILRASDLGPPQAMLAHRLHTPFDTLDVDGTLVPAVSRWLAARTSEAAC